MLSWLWCQSCEVAKLDLNFFETLAQTEDFGLRLSLVLDLMSLGGRVMDSALCKQ